LAVDLQGLLRSVLWAHLAGARRVIGLPAERTRERLSSWLLSARAEPPAHSLHVTDLYLETARAALRSLGVEPRELEPGDEIRLIVLSEGEREWAERTLAANHLERFAVLNPGAAWA